MRPLSFFAFRLMFSYSQRSKCADLQNSYFISYLFVFFSSYSFSARNASPDNGNSTIRLNTDMRPTPTSPRSHTTEYACSPPTNSMNRAKI